MVESSAFIRWIFFFQAEDGIRDVAVTGVQTCALPILPAEATASPSIPRSTRARSSKAAASGLRQMLPVQTSRIRFVFGSSVMEQADPRPEIGRASCRERV